MRNPNKHIFLCVLFNLVFGQQDLYRSVQDIQTEWTGYTSYQKEELVSFCDFLFKEGHYERCLLTSFQLIYKFPEDPILPTINYYIARCYEEMNNYELSHRYYRKVIDVAEDSSIIAIAAARRDIYISLLAGEIEDIFIKTKDTDDPYLIVFRGYGYMKALEWENARATFISAQESFDHPHYNELMIPLYHVIENVSSVPRHNKYLVFLMGSIMPGGGQFILKEWDKGQGILTSVGLMALISYWGKVKALSGNSRFLDSEGVSIPVFKNFTGGNGNVGLTKKDKIPVDMKTVSSSFKYIGPPLFIGAGVFTGSILRSFSDTKEKNKRMIEIYIQERVENISPERFLDFSEPLLIYNK